MNIDREEGKRGASITPSARESIHRYRFNEMGRYGVKTLTDTKKQNRSPDKHDQGIDEVDNIMSKMTRQTSPLPIRKSKLVRTNSYSNDEENSDPDDHVLSKSLPTTLPSYLYSSEDSETEEPNYSAATITSSRHEDSNHSLNLNRSNQSINNLQRSPSYHQNLSASSHARTKRHSNRIQLYLLMLAIVIGFLAMYYTNILQIFNKVRHDKSTQTVSYDQTLFEHNMNNLQEKYNIDDNSILKLKTGISTIFSRKDAGSFMFVYDSKMSNFNPSQFEKFINEVAYTAARYLRNSSIKHTIVLSSNLDMQEHGELINRYRDDVDKTGVLLVKEVDSVPSNLAMAFHYYCDEYDPLVKTSAIFFTLNLANCSNSSDKKSTHEFIEKCLANKWKTVQPENMRPLLTRVVDIIIDVTRV